MTCYGGGHTEIIKEVYKNLMNISDIEITILALTTSKYKFEQERIPCKLITDYYDKEEDKEIYKLGKEFCIKNNIDTLIGKDETYLYHGYALYELEKKYSKEKIKEGFKKFGRAIFLPIQFMERVLKNENPNLVITTNSPRYEKAALIAAKNLDIMSLSIEDLFGVEYTQLTVDIANFFENINYNTIYGNYLCILTDEAKNNLNKEKVNKVFVTGNPSFDKTIKYFNNNKILLEKNSKVLCFLTQNHPEKLDILEKLIEIVDKKDFNLIVKIHPNESKEDYLKVVQSLTKNKEKIFIETENLYENILKSDIVVTIDSTAALEAAILGKPIIGKKNNQIPFERIDIGIEYDDVSQIDECVEKLSKDRELRERLEKGRNLFRPRELAGEKIKKIIENILKNN
jgi:UDP-N-acetylglucosamine 2-epimerase